MSDWVSFYDLQHSIIYVNARHRDAHYARIAGDIAEYVFSGKTNVLDYGSGEALSADKIAEVSGKLVLAEAAPNVRALLQARYANHPKISVMTPEQVAALPPANFEMIVMHSVAQYLMPAELEDLLSLFRRLLTRDGLLVIGDIVPPRFASFTAAWALLQFAKEHGFFWPALRGLFRIATSNYMRLRRTKGLSHYTEDEMIAILAAAGFSANRAERNIGHNQARMTFLAHPSGW